MRNKFSLNLLFALFLILFSFGANNSLAQKFPSEVWHEGKLVLLNEDTIKGLLKYDFVNNMVQCQSNNQIQAYSARKFLYFEIYDKSTELYRTFYALPYNVKSNYKAPVLFEVLMEGNLTLLAREFIVQETTPVYNYYYSGSPEYSYTRNRLDYEYYFLNKNGKIDRYFSKKKELMEFMRKKSSDVKQYIKKNHLRYDQREDLVRITAYYNSLLESKKKEE